MKTFKKADSVRHRAARYRRFGAFILAVSLGTSALPASAADLTWGSGGAGGAGTWDTGVTSNWYNGASDVPWTAGDNATFGGAAGGAVTIDGAGVTVGNLNFATEGYSLWTGPLNLGGSPSTIAVQSGVLPPQAAVLGSAVGGSGGILKTGAGSLVLNAANTFSGNITVRQGALVANVLGALGDAGNTLTLGDASTGAGDIVTLYMGPGINAEATGPQLASITTSNYGAGQAVVLATSDALTYNKAVLIANINLAGSVPLTMKSEVGTPGFGNHLTAQDWAGTITGSGIAAGTTSLILDGTAYNGTPYREGSLRLQFGGVSKTTANTFTGDVIMKGLVATNNTTHSGNDAAHENLGFANNDVTVEAGGNWLFAWGSETTGALKGGGTVTRNDADGQGVKTLTVGNNNNSGTFDGKLTSQLSLTKVGAGTQALTGASDYTGVTTVSAGKLLANNTTGSAFSTGAVTVNGGTLGGTGSFTGAVTVNSTGTLAPGASIESLATGAVTLNDGASFAYEVDSSALNGDLLAVNGNVNINGTVNLDLSETASGTVAIGSKLTLISYTGTLTGTFDGFADGSMFSLGSNLWQIAYHDSTGGSNFTGDQLAGSFVTMTAVPEPSSLALLVLGSLGLGMARRKRRA